MSMERIPNQPGWPDCLECDQPMDPDSVLAGREVCASCLVEVVDVDEEAYDR